MSESKMALLDFKLMQMQEKMTRDLQETLGSPEEQMERLGRLIERCAYPTKDAVFVKCWGDTK